MPIDFDALNDEFPVSFVLRTFFKLTIRNRTFCCPFHDDRSHSGSIFIGKDGRERWRCHACDIGGDSIDLIKRRHPGASDVEAYKILSGREPVVTPEKRKNPEKKPKLHLVFDVGPMPREIADKVRPGATTPEVLHKEGQRKTYTPALVHRYLTPAGDVVLLALRIEEPGKRKFFIQVRWCVKTEGLVATGFQDDERRILYREAELRRHPAKNVLVCEGEKCADLLGSLPAFDDYVVVSWQGGTNQIARQPWDLLRGRAVMLWPDADTPKEGETDGAGAKAMLKVAGLIGEGRIRIVMPPETWAAKKSGYDAVDLITDVGAEEARALVEDLCVEFASQPPPPPPPEDEKGEPLIYLRNAGDGGLATREVSNWSLFVRADPRFPATLTYDVFSREVMADGVPLDDQSVAHLMHQCGLIAGFRGMRPNVFGEMFVAKARTAPVNRLAEELRALAWDRTQRHLVSYAGVHCDGTEGRWARVAGWRWLVGLVRRILEPGCQHDGVLVLEGRQGVGKTSFFRALGHVLGRDLYVEVSKLTQDADVQMRLAGKAVVELSEMIAHRSGESDQLKGMLSARTDFYRPPYGRAPEAWPRTCVFGGSTNETRYLKDLTGNRRYWIVRVDGAADIAALMRDLPQLFAQAVHFIDQNAEPNWLQPDEEPMQVAEAERREEDFPELEGLEELISTEVEMSTDVLWGKLGFDRPRRSQRVSRALKREMERLGWVHDKHHRHEAGPGAGRRSWRRVETDEP